jgi:hypothetical protein
MADWPPFGPKEVVAESPKRRSPLGPITNSTKRGRPPATLTTICSLLERLTLATEAIAGIRPPALDRVDPDDLADVDGGLNYADDTYFAEREAQRASSLVSGREAPASEDERIWLALNGASFAE